MTNHYSALVNAKPTFNTRQKPIQNRRPQTSKPKAAIFEDLNYAEQRETMKRC